VSWAARNRTSLPVFQTEISRSRPSMMKNTRSPAAPVRCSKMASGWCSARPFTGVVDSRVTRAHAFTPARPADAAQPRQIGVLGRLGLRSAS
jgi:hypothetical protein